MGTRRDFLIFHHAKASPPDEKDPTRCETFLKSISLKRNSCGFPAPPAGCARGKKNAAECHRRVKVALTEHGGRDALVEAHADEFPLT